MEFFPMKVKLLSVGKMGHKEIMGNAEINNINCILGL
jgi:DNA gyrase/topoisomerase IV subunit B